MIAMELEVTWWNSGNNGGVPSQQIGHLTIEMLQQAVLQTKDRTYHTT